MVAPLCWEPDLRAVKTAESGFEMDSLIIIATLYPTNDPAARCGELDP
jgi:hypothetical protein